MMLDASEVYAIIKANRVDKFYDYILVLVTNEKLTVSYCELTLSLFGFDDPCPRAEILDFIDEIKRGNFRIPTPFEEIVKNGCFVVSWGPQITEVVESKEDENVMAPEELLPLCGTTGTGAHLAHCKYCQKCSLYGCFIRVVNIHYAEGSIPMCLGCSRRRHILIAQSAEHYQESIHETIESRRAIESAWPNEKWEGFGRIELNQIKLCGLVKSGQSLV